LSTLFVLTGGGTAHAHPGFAVVEQQARAGDTVHFSITGARNRVNYEIEVADREVVQGSATGTLITGEFTMPALGESARTFKVEAEMYESGKKTKVKPKIEYLGLALPRPEPARVEEPAAPVALPNALPAPNVPAPASAHESAPAPAAAPATTAAPVSPARAVRRGTRRARRTDTRRHTRARPHRAEAGGLKPHRGRHARKTRKTRSRRGPHARTAPLFDGVPEPGSGSFDPGSVKGFSALNAILPPTVTVAGATADNAAGADPPVALLVPGLLGLAALTLAGTALHRRRTLRRRR
jgi:hypothetical protein